MTSQAESTTPLGTYPTLDYMVKEELPLDRETYLSLAYLDKDKVLTSEEEMEVPPEFRKSVAPDSAPKLNKNSEVTSMDLLREDNPQLSDAQLEAIANET